MVIDGAVTLTGSYNWTREAAANSENLNLISSPAVAAAYSAHWRDRLAVSPIAGKTGAGSPPRKRADKAPAASPVDEQGPLRCNGFGLLTGGVC